MVSSGYRLNSPYAAPSLNRKALADFLKRQKCRIGFAHPPLNLSGLLVGELSRKRCNSGTVLRARTGNHMIDLLHRMLPICTFR